MERLNPLSAAFLIAEDIDPAASLAIGSFAVLDGPAPSIDELRVRISERLDLVPRYTQKVHRTPFDLTAPSWVDDVDFDLDDHVRHVALPSPGGAEQIAELIGWVMSTRMDRQHALWEIVLCEGLEDGRWGLLCRVHHALADGLSATALLRVLYDDEDGGRTAPRLVPGADHGESRVDVAAHAVRGGLTLSTALLPGPQTSLTGPLGRARGYAWHEVGIASARAVRERHGVSLNDVALASVAGGFRALLEERGLAPDARALRTLVPVSAWRSTDLTHPDNQVSLMLPLLPVEEADPIVRLQLVHERVRALRRGGEPTFGAVVQLLAERMPYALVGRATRWGLRFPQRQVTTVMTNVPGPRRPLHCLGRPVRQMLPYVPIADRIRLGVAMFSYCDALTFGVTVDADSTTDGDVLARGIGDAWRELVAG